MGRKTHGQSLSIWANGARVGRWTIPRRGEMELQYDPEWIASDIGRPLSLSLPFNLNNLPLRGSRVAHFFDNLLPGNDTIRRRAAERFSIGSTAPFDLLKAIGRDCVGAVQILQEDEIPRGFDRIEGIRLSAKDMERHLAETVSSSPLAPGSDADDGFRLSLAMALRGKNRHYRMQDIQRRHFNSTAQAVGYAATAKPIIETLLARTPAAIAEAQADLPPGFSAQVAETILGGLQNAAEQLARMPP